MTEGDEGGVYCWDHAHCLPGSSEANGNTYFMAPSFSAFMRSLEPLEEDHGSRGRARIRQVLGALGPPRP